MMKKFLIKWNMAFILVMILFANVSLGATPTQEELPTYLNDKLTFFDAIAEPWREDGSRINAMNTFISKELLQELENDGVQIIYYSDASIDTYLGARIGNDGPIVKISVVDNDNITHNFATIRGNVIVANADLPGAVQASGIGKEVVLKSSDLNVGEGYSFIVPQQGLNVSEAKLQYVNEDGTTSASMKPSSSTINAPSNVHEWSIEGEIILDEENMTEINGQKVYAFTVPTTASYSIPNYSNNILIGNSSNSTAGVIVPGGYDANDQFSNECVVLSEGVTYYFTGEPGTKYSYKFEQSRNLATGDINIDSSDIKDKSIFELIEEIMSGFILSIAKVINWLISIVAGRTLTLDDLIFNNFTEIRLDFFKTDVFGTKVSDTSQLVADLRGPINSMYNFFRNLVLVGYMILLIYVGIKMMLSSTTAKRQAMYKETFMAWVTGIIILFFMPYFMKYVIALDDAIVKYIASDSEIRSEASKNNASNTAQWDTSKGFMGTDFDNGINYSGATDYMSTIGRIATSKLKLGYSIAYLVLTWQIIVLLVYYYKRVFIVALLIMIFPLIDFTFVWDKLNDGRSQALSAWMKEFCITVFVQAFHAIVYVFITNAIYATLTTSNADFILLIIASSFLFAGEDILKKMFGGGGEALGSATQSATKIALITRGAFGVGKRVVHNTVGKDGFVRKNARSFREARTYGFLMRKPAYDATGNYIPRNERKTNFEILADAQAASQRESYLPSDGTVPTQNLKDADEMIHLLNNMKDGDDFAKAYKLYNRLMDARNGNGSNPMTQEEMKKFDEMMKRSNISYGQLEGLNAAMLKATQEATLIEGSLMSRENNPKLKKINQNLRLEIEALFPETDSNGRALTGSANKKATQVMQGVVKYMKENGVSAHRKGMDVNKAWEEALQKTRDEYGLIKIARNGTRDDYERARQSRDARADVIFAQYSQRFTNLSAKEEQKARNFAKKIATIEQTRVGDASAYELMNAIKNVDETEEDKELANMMLQIANIDSDIENLKYLIAKKLNSEGSLKDSRNPNVKLAARQATEVQKWASQVVEQMESHARKDAENYATTGTCEDVDNPYFTILNIIESAQNGIIAERGTTSGGSGPVKISNIDEMLEKAQINGANSDVIERKKEATRVLNQRELIRSQEFAEQAMRLGESSARDQGYDYRKVGSDYKISEPDLIGERFSNALQTGKNIVNNAKLLNERRKAEAERINAIQFDGYTMKEIKELRDENAKSTATGVMQMITDIVATPVSTMAGFAIGTAVTDDFMPIEEAALGSISGNKVAEVTTQTVASLTAEKERQEKISKIKKEIGKRNKTYERERLQARKAFEDAAYEAREGRDNSLVFTGANANVNIEADGSLSVSIHLMAQNAAFVSVSETSGAPSGGWQAYQDNIYYHFNDADPAKPHTLYIYVRDRSGNIEGKMIAGIRGNVDS